jgi:OOP family OmpA-OmpF porin
MKNRRTISGTVKAAVAGAVATTCLVTAAQTSAPSAGGLKAILFPQVERISDEVIYKDQKTYEALQARLNAQKQAIKGSDYATAKAQCWLDVSFHEYHRNDRTDFPQAALSESEKIVAGLESGQKAVGLDTPLVDGAHRLREDLWAKANDLKGARGFSCAAAATGCLEVYLVQAGHEHRQFEMKRHTGEIIAQAEEFAAEARRQADNCPQPVKPQAVKPVPPVAEEIIAIEADALFRFDKYQTGDMLTEGRAKIDEVLDKARAQFVRIDGIHLIGHTDRLGSDAYNQRLSERRAATVKAYLIQGGMAAGTITTEGRGEREPVKTSCVGEVATRALTECLQPNRRVEFRFTGVRKH